MTTDKNKAEVTRYKNVSKQNDLEQDSGSYSLWEWKPLK